MYHVQILCSNCRGKGLGRVARSCQRTVDYYFFMPVVEERKGSPPTSRCFVITLAGRKKWSPYTEGCGIMSRGKAVSTWRTWWGTVVTDVRLGLIVLLEGIAMVTRCWFSRRVTWDWMRVYKRWEFMSLVCSDWFFEMPTTTVPTQEYDRNSNADNNMVRSRARNYW